MRQKVEVTFFGKTKLVPLVVYEGQRRLDDPEPRWDRVLWVERGEDWYSLMAMEGRVLVVQREDFIRAPQPPK